jgi:glycosyltransferase involved in cell wall biosynthesis
VKCQFPALSLSVVLPAYNEEQNIERTLPRAVESLRRLVGSFEVILIDDCSQDRTAELGAALAERFAEIRLVRNPVNLRQGGCLQKGFELARHEWVTHNAMDYPFDFDDLPVLLRHLPEADLVVASRRSYPGTSAARRFVSWSNRTLIGTLFGTRISDYNFVQIYRRSVLDALPSLSSATSFITAEKIIRACRSGLRVVVVEIDYHARLAGRPSSANLKNIRWAVRDMARLWLELRRQERTGRP